MQLSFPVDLCKTKSPLSGLQLNGLKSSRRILHHSSINETGKSNVSNAYLCIIILRQCFKYLFRLTKLTIICQSRSHDNFNFEKRDRYLAYSRQVFVSKRTLNVV